MRRGILTILGLLGILLGSLWTLQGLGIVKWPASSFMISQKIWAIRGGALLLVSIVLVAAMRALPDKPAGRR
jgi:hypothetical protein